MASSDDLLSVRELVGLVTYIYKIVPHTRGFYSVYVYMLRAARVCSCACASIFVRISAVPWALGSWAHGAGGWGKCEWRVGSGPRSIALHAPKPSRKRRGGRRMSGRAARGPPAVCAIIQNASLGPWTVSRYAALRLYKAVVLCAVTVCRRRVTP